jgi:predicted nucleic acid-binding protein
MSETPRRVVLDTNVVASALLFPGPTTAQVRRAWISGSIVPLVCRDTTLELVRVLAYPRFGLTEEEISQLLAEYLPWCEVLDGVGGLQVITPAQLISR